jgi:hypothetical protein
MAKTWSELRLPAGYWLERDADIPILHQLDGSVVVAFNARGINPTEIVEAAREDTERDCAAR